jgi:hypothetical protein
MLRNFTFVLYFYVIAGSVNTHYPVFTVLRRRGTFIARCYTERGGVGKGRDRMRRE